MSHPVPLRNFVLILIAVAALAANVACGGGAAGASFNGGGNTTPTTPGSPALSLSPVTVEFSEQPLATPSNAQTVLVKNTGSASLAIGSIAVTGDFSESHNCETSLAPNGSCTVSVTFVPSATGTRTGELKIVDSSATKQYSVTVRGKGVTKAQLTSDTSSLAFGSVTIGSSSTKSVKFTNTGGQNLTISALSTSLSAFSASTATLPVTLTPGASTTVNVSFGPTSSSTISGTLYVTNSTSNQPYAIPLSGTGTAELKGQLTASAASLNFGNVTVGQSSNQTLTLSNTGTATLTVSAINVAGTGFSLSGLTAPFTLAPGASSSATVTFKPSASGTASGTITLTNSASAQPLTIALAGTASAPAQLTADVTGLNFGTVTIGQSSTKTVKLTNTGGASLTISAFKVNVAGYSVSGATTPLTVNAGGSVTLSVTFVPTTSGSLTGGLYVSHSAGTQPLGIGVSGVGAAAAQLTPSVTSLNFGTVVLGQSSTQTVKLSNTGGTTLTLSSATINGGGFTMSGLTPPVTLAAGASTNVSITFKPSSSATASGTLSVVNSGSAQPLTIALTGVGATAAQLSASSTNLSFGTLTIGDSSSQAVTLRNTGGVSLTISSVAAAGAGFSISGLTTPSTLAPGATTNLTITFKPSQSGTVTGSLTINNTASVQPLAITVSGTGATPAQLVPSTTAINFGTVVVGQTGSQTITFSNSGGTTATVSSISTSGPGFAITGVSLPLTIAAGSSRNVGVTFSPSNSGTASGSIYVATSTAQNITINLAGIATDPPVPVTHSVTVSWNPSASTVSGYYVYRGVQSGGPYTRLNSSVETGTLYTDDTVENGRAYYYVVTTVDQKSVESSYSNQVVANVPAS